MYYHIFSQRDTTLYEIYPTRNTGRDSILELTKIACGSLYEGNAYGVNYNSRILLQFESTLNHFMIGNSDWRPRASAIPKG